MFGSMKKAMIAGAIVAAVGAAAPAMASAEQWSVGGAPYAGPAQLRGTLTVTAGTSTTTCPTLARTDLDNGAAGGAAQGQLQQYLLGRSIVDSPACTTTVPGCSVSVAAILALPWPITTSGRNVTFSGINYYLSYSGASCPWNGGVLGVSGSVTGSVANGSNGVVFSNASGLTTSVGPGTMSGTLAAYVEKPTGAPDLTKPITLQP